MTYRVPLVSDTFTHIQPFSNPWTGQRGLMKGPNINIMPNQNLVNEVSNSMAMGSVFGQQPYSLPVGNMGNSLAVGASFGIPVGSRGSLFDPQHQGLMVAPSLYNPGSLSSPISPQIMSFARSGPTLDPEAEYVLRRLRNNPSGIFSGPYAEQSLRVLLARNALNNYIQPIRNGKWEFVVDAADEKKNRLKYTENSKTVSYNGAGIMIFVMYKGNRCVVLFENEASGKYMEARGHIKTSDNLHNGNENTLIHTCKRVAHEKSRALFDLSDLDVATLNKGIGDHKEVGDDVYRCYGVCVDVGDPGVEELITTYGTNKIAINGATPTTLAEFKETKGIAIFKLDDLKEDCKYIFPLPAPVADNKVHAQTVECLNTMKIATCNGKSYIEHIFGNKKAFAKITNAIPVAGINTYKIKN